MRFEQPLAGVLSRRVTSPISRSLLPLALVLGGGLLGGRADAQPCVFPDLIPQAPPTSLPANGADLILADFNRDGNLDAAVSNDISTPNTKISVFIGDGAGGFGVTPVNTAFGTELQAMAAGDLNRDGLLDIVVVNKTSPTSGQVVRVLGTGSGTTFVTPSLTVYGGSQQIDWLRLVDLNRDGRLDLVISDTGQGGFRVLIGDGNGGFSSNVLLASGQPLGQPAIADFDGDGMLDIVAPQTLTASLLFFKGDGVWLTPIAPTSIATGIRGVPTVAGDFDRDGDADVVMGDQTLGFVHVVRGRGDGTFETVIDSFTVQNAPGKLAAADLDRDGDPDLVATIKVTGGLNVLRNDGAGKFPSNTPLPGTIPAGLATGDLNEDGRIDVVHVRPASQLVRHLNLFGAPCANLSFAPAARLFAAASDPRGLSRGDFNNDGRPDVVTANGVPDRVSLLLANASPIGTFADPVTFPAGSGPRYPAVGDFDKDGDLDVAVTLSGANAVSILVGTGTGSLGPPNQIFLVGTPAGVAVGDLNGDGDLDLAISLSNSQVAILAGGSLATFGAPTYAPTGVGSAPTWVTSGDYNQDGKLDLVVSDGAQNGIVYLQGRGDLSFDPPLATSVFPSQQPVMVVTGDWDLNGTLDVATVNQLSNDVTALRGNGGGGFTVVSTTGAGGSAPVSLAVGHFDLDSLPDLVTSDGTDESVSVLLGLGGGSFFRFDTVKASGQPKMAIGGDFTGDGLDDVVVVNGLSSAVALLRGKGDGALQTSDPEPVVEPPVRAVAGDFDRDGILDVAVATADSTPAPPPVDVVTVFHGGGDGSFPLVLDQITKNTAARARDLVTADFNRDGKLDLAVLYDTQLVEVHFGNGDGTFGGIAASMGTGVNPTALVTGDFDRDGDVDFAYSNNEAVGTSDTVCISLNNGLGTGFTVAGCPTLGIDVDPRHLATGDFNRDGITDLVTANNSGGLSLLRGMTGGAFAGAVAFSFVPAANRPAFVAVADFDLDMNVDLAVADDSANTIRFAKNNTTPGGPVLNFTNASMIPATLLPLGPLGIAPGDFNGDGKQDLAVAAKGLRGLAVFPGTASFAFTTVSHYGAGSGLGGPNQVLAEDWNRDGKTDLLATDDSGRAFSVTLNTNCTSQRLKMQMEPSACNPVSPAPLTVQPRLTLTDDGDNTDQCALGSVAASLASGPGTLSGTLTVGVTNGNADFTNLSVSPAGAGYRLGFLHGLTSIPARSRRFTAGLTVSITGPPLVCEGQPTVWTASPPTFERYQWKLDSLIVGGDSPSVTLGGLTPMLHTLELQAVADGCTQMASVPILPTANLSSVTLNLGPGSPMVCTGAACLGATVSLTEVGGGAITGRQWSYRTTSGVGPEIPLGGETGAVYQIQGSDFPGPGVYYLVEISMPTCGSPLVSSNEVQVTVFGTTAGPRLPVFTGTSTHNQNQLEWLNPPGPYEGTLIKYNKSTTGTSDCTVPLDPGQGTLLTLQGAPAMADQRDSKLHDTLEDNTTYCYAAFAAVLPNVYQVPGRPLKARPFDNTVGSVKWAFSTGTSTLSAPGLGPGVVHFVDQEGVVHSVRKGTSGGTWAPLPWKPPVMLLPSQTGRPSAIPVTVAGETPVLFLSSQDGHVYAFSSATGNSVWTPPPSLGTMVQASPSGVFQMFGGPKNLILVGSRNAGANSFYGLDLFNNGSFGALPGWSYSGDITFGQIGMINGQAAVDQTVSPARVYFASHAFGGTNTLWCLDLETGAPLWAVPIGNVSGGVTLRSGTLYIGLDGGNVMAYNASNGSPKWSAPYPTTPNTVKGFVFADRLSDDLYFSAGNLLYSVSDDGAGVNGWTDNWGGGVAFTTSPSTPVVLSNDPNQHVYVGGNGRLFRRRQSNGAAFDEFVLGDGVAVTGSPTFDLFDGMAYVGTEEGAVYAVKVLP